MTMPEPPVARPTPQVRRLHQHVVVGTVVGCVVGMVATFWAFRWEPSQLGHPQVVWSWLTGWALLQVGLVWGWTRLTDIPDRLGARVAMVVAGVCCVLAAPSKSSTWLLAAVFVGFVAVGAHQLSRITGRQRLVHSMAATTVGMVLMVVSVTSLWYLPSALGAATLFASFSGAACASVAGFWGEGRHTPWWGAVAAALITSVLYLNRQFTALPLFGAPRVPATSCQGAECWVASHAEPLFMIVVACLAALCVGAFRQTFAAGLDGWGWSARFALMTASLNVCLALPLVIVPVVRLLPLPALGGP